MNIPQLEGGENGVMPEVVNQSFLFQGDALQESRKCTQRERLLELIL